MALHGDIRVNHRKIGEWQAVCQPGKDGIHPYRWGATLNGITVRGVLTHTRADGALVLASKVCAEAARMLSEAESAPGAPQASEPHKGTLETGGAQIRDSLERARVRPEFQALIDAFQPEYDALRRKDNQ